MGQVAEKIDGPGLQVGVGDDIGVVWAALFDFLTAVTGIDRHEGTGECRLSEQRDRAEGRGGDGDCCPARCVKRDSSVTTRLHIRTPGEGFRLIVPHVRLV